MKYEILSEKKRKRKRKRTERTEESA